MAVVAPKAPSQPKMTEHQMKDLFVQVFADQKSPMEAIREMAEKMFPNDDLERRAKVRRLEAEMDEFLKQLKVYCSDSYDDYDVYRFTLEIEPEKFIELRPKLLEMLEYLVNKYEMAIDFQYNMWDYKGYNPPKENEEKKVVEKPKLPVDYDIELE